MSLLLTGMGGVLGLGLAEALPPAAGAALQPVVAGRRPPAAWAGTVFQALELEEEGAAARLVAALRPALVLHAAAWSRLDACEAEPARAWRVNAEAPAELAAACAATGAFLVLVSTDQVFGGETALCREDDPPAPLHHYGRSKAEAEARVRAAGGAVARLPLLLGRRAPGVRGGADAALLAALAAGERPCLYTDEIRAPAGAREVARGLLALLRARQPGCYHFGGAQALSRAELGERICAAAGVPPAFERGPAPQGGAAPTRPRRLVLDCRRARQELGWMPPDLRQSLAHLSPGGPGALPGAGPIP